MPNYVVDIRVDSWWAVRVEANNPEEARSLAIRKVNIADDPDYTEGPYPDNTELEES